MAGADGQRVVACEGEGGFVITGPAHQPFTGGLAESQPEADARNCAHQCLVEVFHGLDEMRLAEDELAASGLTMGTTVSSMAELQQVSYAVHGRPPEGDCKPPQALDFTPYRACHRLPRGSRTLGHFAGRVDGAEARCSDQGS